MRKWALGAAAVIAAAWLAMFATGNGLLVHGRDLMWSELPSYPRTGPGRDIPVGLSCTYLTHAGLRTARRIERAQGVEFDADGNVVSTCAAFHDFAARA